MEEHHKTNLHDRIHLSPSPPNAFTNQHCSCPLGTAGSNDFRCIADPSTFRPLKAHTNSPFPVHTELSSVPYGPRSMQSQVRAELTGQAWESINEILWETSTKNYKENAFVSALPPTSQHHSFKGPSKYPITYEASENYMCCFSGRSDKVVTPLED